MKPKPGRPSIPDELRRNKFIHVIVTGPEYKSICKAADQAGESLSTFCRDVILKAMTRGDMKTGLEALKERKS